MNTNKASRETKQRNAILGFLMNTRSHPTADQIYETVRKTIPTISKGTVYRNLQVLIDIGIVSVLDIRGTLSRYELKQETHYHFRCDACGRVYDLDEPVDPGLDDRISKRTGFVVSGHQTEFRGRCADCQRPAQQISVKES
jgi:Fur family transcriptional regulator, peroxide stress response regulator